MKNKLIASIGALLLSAIAQAGYRDVYVWATDYESNYDYVDFTIPAYTTVDFYLETYAEGAADAWVYVDYQYFCDVWGTDVLTDSYSSQASPIDISLHVSASAPTSYSSSAFASAGW